MAFTIQQQIHEAFGRARNVLIICRADAAIDDLVSALAVREFLTQQGKHIDVVCDDFKPNANLKFIPNINFIQSRIGSLHQFKIKLLTAGHELESVHQEQIGNELLITITPRTGVLTKELVSTESSQFKYDLLVVIGAQDFASLGKMYTENTELFTTVPVITIDHSPAHEFFGHINHVDVTLTSNAEVVHSLFSMSTAGAATYDFEITQTIAQLLLTGMIAATQSFKTSRVTARTLQTASTLIGLGADRELVVHHLYRQRSIATLKLWGAALTHVQTDPQLPLMWSSLTREDFARAGAGEDELIALIDELVSTAPNAKVFALVYEHPTRAGELRVIVDAHGSYNALTLMAGYREITGTRERVSGILHTNDDTNKTTLADTLQKITNVLRVKMRA